MAKTITIEIKDCSKFLNIHKQIEYHSNEIKKNLDKLKEFETYNVELSNSTSLSSHT